MNELESKVFEFVLEGKSVNDIESRLCIDNKQLINVLNNLKNDGISIKKKYYVDGNIKFTLNKNMMPFDTLENTRLRGNISKLKLLVISDLHFGSFHDRVDLLNKAYQYAKENGINIILNLGDLIDGTSIEYNLSKNKTMYEQFKYLLNNYPYYKDIITFIVLGNHDIYPLSNGFNLINLLHGNRLDLVPIGIGASTLEIGDSSIGMYHQTSFKSKYNYYKVKDGSESEVNLFGHSHLYEKEFSMNRLFIKVPTLSDILLEDVYNKKKISNSQGMIELFLLFQDEKIKTAQIKYLKLDPYIRVYDEKRYSYKKRK